MTTDHQSNDTGSMDDAETIDAVMGRVDDGSHLDNLRAADVDDAGEVDHAVMSADDWEAQQDDATGQSDQIDKDGFWIVFQSAFAIPGGFVPDFAPLAIQENEVAGGRAASDAIHSLLQIYYPKALSPAGETLGHLMVAVPFLLVKVQIAKAIIAARKQPRDVTPPDPANDNAAPAEDEAPKGFKDTPEGQAIFEKVAD